MKDALSDMAWAHPAELEHFSIENSKIRWEKQEPTPASSANSEEIAFLMAARGAWQSIRISLPLVGLRLMQSARSLREQLKRQRIAHNHAAFHYGSLPKDKEKPRQCRGY